MERTAPEVSVEPEERKTLVVVGTGLRLQQETVVVAEAGR